MTCGDRFKEFFELVIEFDIPIRDKRKYNSLVKSIPESNPWSSDTRDPYNMVLRKLLQAKKVQKFAPKKNRGKNMTFGTICLTLVIQMQKNGFLFIRTILIARWKLN